MPLVDLIFGAGGIGKGRISHSWTTSEQTNELLSRLHELGLHQLDSGAAYPPGAPWVTETLLGQTKAAEKGFLIDTKIIPSPITRAPDPEAKVGAHSLTEENINASSKKSFEMLEVDKVNILYTHFPDPVTPIEETAKAFDRLFRAGNFKQLGVSNFGHAGLKEWLRICEEKDYVRPSVYQVTTTHCADTVNQVCTHFSKNKASRLLLMGGPLAGGFLTGKVSLATPETDLSGGRWAPGGHHYYPLTFDKPAVHAAMKEFCKVCEENGISTTEASLRWLVHHSALRDGDGIILGATRVDQLEGSIKFCWKGPLDEGILKALEELWEAVKDDTGVTAFL